MQNRSYRYLISILCILAAFIFLQRMRSSIDNDQSIILAKTGNAISKQEINPNINESRRNLEQYFPHEEQAIDNGEKLTHFLSQKAIV